MPINITIDELVVIDVGAVDRRRFETAFRRELARLIAGGLEAPAGSTARLDAGAVELEPGGRPEVFARAVARAVYRAIAI